MADSRASMHELMNDTRVSVLYFDFTFLLWLCNVYKTWYSRLQIAIQVKVHDSSLEMNVELSTLNAFLCHFLRSFFVVVFITWHITSTSVVDVEFIFLSK